ncbi:cell wall / vacuolar inhibitor of fructosidase 2-like [Primulina eburnea]|uniref:cell wall / vacuolar inhibitor of fructosidase 2-like n=1 Tax=Primulina eburnea TaxID=1245227 RepID=UPI003C6C82F8
MAKNVVFSIVFVLASISFFSQGNADMSLIENVCKKTFDYKLCVSSLKSNPRSFNTDVKGLARIMIDVTQSKIEVMIRVVQQLGKNASDLRERECLDNVCYPEYGRSRSDIKQAIEDLQSNSFREAYTDVHYVYSNEEECENSFAELEIKSPMTTINTHFAAFCKITEDIIGILLK